MKITFRSGSILFAGKLAFTIVALLLIMACHKTDIPSSSLKNFKQVNLVANKQNYHPVSVDPTLINGFGLAWSPNGIAWVNSVGGHVSELYNADGTISLQPVHIPSPIDEVSGLPCGIVFSANTGFKTEGIPATFLFSGFDGVLSAWNPNFGTSAKKILTVPGSSFTGLALAAKGSNNFLYAANFAGARIDVWDTSFASVSMAFKDPLIPEGFSPYNIQAIDGLLFVMYAEIGENGLPVSGKGKGFVNVFSPDGNFLRRFATEGSLNVPWGITSAPVSFLQSNDVEFDGAEKTFSDAANASESGSIDHLILVGNFGDGRINVFTDAGKFIGQLKSGNRVIQIDGLWALSFAPDTAPIDPGRLYFTAGPARETDGLFGYLIKQ